MTTLVICFTPGAAAITVASQGAANGGRRALFGAAGVVWGNVIYSFCRRKASHHLSSHRTMFIKGFVIELANPKALLYFAAVLPQFLDTSSPIAIQFLIMGVTTFFLDCLAYGSYAFLGDRLTRGGMKEWVVSAVNKTAGTALIFAGIKMATVTANN